MSKVYRVSKPWYKPLCGYEGQRGILVDVLPSAMGSTHDGILLRMSDGKTVLWSRNELTEEGDEDEQ
jgi:hypothetical protein